MIALRRLVLVLLVAMTAALPTALPAGAQQQEQAQQPQTGASGLPLPRFVSLAADRINVRTGPGKQYPIRWIYARNGLPVKIVEEFDTWRKIQDQDGDDGWVHVSLLSSRRTVAITNSLAELHRSADATSNVVVRAEPGVIGKLVSCNPTWCEIEVERRRGWLERTHFWGVLPNESTLPTS